MVKQINLDSWQISHLTELLQKASTISEQTGEPVMLYRQTIEEEGDSYEEIVCSIIKDYVIEQLVTSGGVIVPTFCQQRVYRISEYPNTVLAKSKERFQEIIDMLEEMTK